MTDISEYIPQQGQNGNGHQKPFVLERPKSPDEIAQEGMRKIAPQIRRAVRSMRIPAQAKFLFDAILDDTFMYDFGGDAHGMMVASVRDLAKRYGHDKDSITKWAEILVRKEVLWVEQKWPYQEWRITALSPAPQMKANLVQRVKARASSARRRNNSEDKGQPLFLGKNGQSPSKSEGIGVSSGQIPANKAEGRGQSDRRNRTERPTPSVTKVGHLRSRAPIPSDTLTGTSPQDAPIPSVTPSEGEGLDTQCQPVVTGKSWHLEKSPDYKTLENTNNDQRLRGNAFKKGGETGFLVHVAEVLTPYSRKEAERETRLGPGGSGAWWLSVYRKDPDKAARVLAEIKRMITEKVPFRKSPGAAAVDIWQERFK